MDKDGATDITHEEKSLDSKPDLVHGESVGAKLAVDDSLEHDLTVRYMLANHKKLIAWTFFWALCAIGWGFDAQVNGAMISVPAFRRDFGYVYGDEYVLPADWQSAFNTISSPGALIGAFCCSWLADRYGRKSALMAAIVTCTAGIIGQLLSTTRIAFLMSKLFLGLGLGFYLTIGPMMTSELTPVVLRGMATAGVNLGIALGQLLSNSVVAAFGARTDRWAYRAPFAFQLAFIVILLIGFPFAPESPIFLVKKGRMEDARKVLKQIWGDDIDVDAKLISLETTIAEERAGKHEISFKDCFRGTNRQRTMISMGVFVCQHAVGIIFVLGYSSYFFQLAGLNVSMSFNLGVGVTACGVAGNVASWFVINSWGRRKMFVYGMAMLSAMLVIIGILDVVPTGAAKWVQAAITVVWAFVYFFSIGAVAFALLGETSSASLRAPTAALATATQAVMGLCMSFAIPYLVNPDEANLRGKVGFIFGGLGVLGTVWAYFFVPELKGRTFREIDALFVQRVPPRNMGSHQL